MLEDPASLPVRFRLYSLDRVLALFITQKEVPADFWTEQAHCGYTALCALDTCEERVSCLSTVKDPLEHLNLEP